MSKEPRSPAYPEHDPKEDVYRQEKHKHLDSNEGKLLDDRSGKPKPRMVREELLDDSEVIRDRTDDAWNEENFDENHTGDDLDVPGSESDDSSELPGTEDEENNYYSLGGPDKES